MKEYKEILINLGLTEKEILVYIELLKKGPGSVRELSKRTNLNRGSVFEALKALRQSHLVTLYNKKSNHLFTAEEPSMLLKVAKTKKEETDRLFEDIKNIVPGLRSIYSKASNKPVVSYFEGDESIKNILMDVLESVSSSFDKEYYLYSPSNPFIYKLYPEFSVDRINLDIKVKAIGLGRSGEKYGKDERKYLNQSNFLQTYTFIYSGKIAMISEDELMVKGVVIEDENLYKTQKFIFEDLWNRL